MPRMVRLLKELNTNHKPYDHKCELHIWRGEYFLFSVENVPHEAGTLHNVYSFWYEMAWSCEIWEARASCMREACNPLFLFHILLSLPVAFAFIWQDFFQHKNLRICMKFSEMYYSNYTLCFHLCAANDIFLYN